MGILKRALSEALAPFLRRPSAKHSSAVAPHEQPADKIGARDAALRKPGAARPGMCVVILNWRRGENDPFSVVNATIREHLRACGKNVETIEIASNDWPQRLAELVPTGIEFALTWQGLGSQVEVGDSGTSLWEHFRIPLMCLHGDHPSHTPLNHQLESRYCFHLYTNADFARYSNRHLRRWRGASLIDIPQLHREPRLEQTSGEYFVVAKNVTHPIDTERIWKEKLDEPTFAAYMAAAEVLKRRIAEAPYVEMHDVLDELITERDLQWLRPETNVAAFHQYHSRLDHYLRSYKSVAAVTALREFPVRVYGRGWERTAQSAPAQHVFAPGRNMADSQALYYSQFGLVDISPSKGLHDRARRAMANGVGFLSSANLEDSFPAITRFDRLFFSFGEHELAEKCAAVVADAEAHREVAREFADLYHSTYHFKQFVNRLDMLAKSVGDF
jgi:hypothetical protein